MKTLPFDVLHCICEELKDQKRTLKAVRLVNKTLAIVATRFLFHTLLVYQTPKSWEKLGSIARCEWLSRYVFKVEVAALEYLPHYSDFEDWKQCTWYSRWSKCRDQNNRAVLVFSLLKSWNTESSMKSLDPHLYSYMYFDEWKHCPEIRKWKDQSDKRNSSGMIFDFTQAAKFLISKLDSALGLVHQYERYRYWHDGENELSDLLYQSINPCPLPHLSPLPNLQTVAVLGSDELWKDSIWPLAEADRRTRETAVHPSAWVRVEKVRHNAHLSLALQMLETRELSITRLELHRYREVLVDVQVPVPTLKHLQELVLDFPYDVNYKDVFGYAGRWELPAWLRGADELRTVIIKSQDPEKHDFFLYFDVIALFHGTEWPKLQCVNFKEAFVRPKSLLRFLSEHRRSLESVHIEKPVISTGAWHSLASEFLALEFHSPDCIVRIDALDRYSDMYSSDCLEDDSVWVDQITRPR